MMKNKEKPAKFEFRLTTKISDITYWRCTTCGGLHKTQEKPALCELCGEGKNFEKMQIKIKTNEMQDLKK
ncbi:MAG: hypothetical protein KIH08_01535 [Candidatus Freyarchaeota archaeon]|nr:hypothetical protein [Candidatus Jordarchaeia archaeon]MBS7269898.1 hypothetical protein [Candidatus Jordarchaeia archaeon]